MWDRVFNESLFKQDKNLRKNNPIANEICLEVQDGVQMKPINWDNAVLTYSFEYNPGTVKYTGCDFKEPEYLLILEDYGDVKQGSVVELIVKKSHYSLCVTTEGELWVRNEILDPYYAPGEEVWVDITTKWMEVLSHYR